MGDKFVLILPFVFGAVIGSFLNVCIYRIPIGLSIVSPPSKCPSCGRNIPFYYNIPIISYVVLMGRCGLCGAPISPRYLLVESFTGLAAVSLFLKFGPSFELLAYFVFVSSLIVVTFIDLKYQIIPDVISLPGIAVGLAASFFIPSVNFLNSFIGILAGGGVLFGIATAYYLLTGKEGMGGGDVKLLGMIGAFLGWKGVIVTLLLGSFLGAVIGSFIMLLSGKGSRHPIPFGPFLAIGAAAHLFLGEELIRWYIVTAVGA
ncbi:MAG: prepilin peptidase [Deltaproteobacteria bacterium]|nr:prepilin peptidase [Deltaproteobacteria bacterium]